MRAGGAASTAGPARSRADRNRPDGAQEDEVRYAGDGRLVLLPPSRLVSGGRAAWARPPGGPLPAPWPLFRALANLPVAAELAAFGQPA